VAEKHVVEQKIMENSTKSPTLIQKKEKDKEEAVVAIRNSILP